MVYYSVLTAYRNSSKPYTMVPFLTHHDVWFSHNTCVTDKQTNDTLYPMLDLTINQNHKNLSRR